MKNFLLTFILVMVFCFTTAQTPNFQWVKNTFGNNSSVIDIVSDQAGNFYVTGYFFSSEDFNPGPSSNILTPLNGDDIYVVKLDPSGNFMWARQIDNGMVEQPMEIYVDVSGNVTVTGIYRFTFSSNYTIFVSRFNVNGTLLWNNQLTGPSTSTYGAGVGYSTFIDNSGDVYVNGDFNDTVDVDPSLGTFLLYGNQMNFTPLIAKFSSVGGFYWARALNKVSPTGGGRGYSIVVDNVGNVYSTGYFEGTVDFDPSVSSYTMNTTISDAYLLKLNSSGNIVWAKSLSGSPTHYSRGSAVRLDNSSNLYYHGWIYGTADLDPGVGTYTISAPPSSRAYYVGKLDPSGNFLWAAAVSGMTVYSMDNDGTGNSYLAGNFTGTQDFDPGLGTFTLSSYGVEDGFFIKLDANGNFIWAGQIGDSNPNSVARIGVSGLSDVYSWGTAGTGICDMDPGSGVYAWSASTTNEYFLKVGQTSTGINEDQLGLQVWAFPNPTSGQFNLQFNKVYENFELKVFNSIRQTVLQKKVLNTDRLALSISNQPAGVYFIELSAEGNIYRTKVVKE